MNLIKPSYEILALNSGATELLIEQAGRVCYKSEDKICDGSAQPFIQKILGRHHESVIEHSSLSVRFIVDRGVSHELVRHRLASFSQESTRYCNYGKKGMTVIIPPWVNIEPREYDRDFVSSTSWSVSDAHWFAAMRAAAGVYEEVLRLGWTPQQARSVLPNSLKTEIVVTANYREWRHILMMRTSTAAHPQMREIMLPLLADLKQRIPVIFDNITP